MTLWALMVLAALLLLAAQDPKHTPLEGSVVASKSSGRFRGRAFLEVMLRWWRLPGVAHCVAKIGVGAGAAAAARATRLPVETPILFSRRSTLRLKRA